MKIRNCVLILLFSNVIIAQLKIVNNKFQLHHQLFTPLIMNYGVNIRFENNGSYFISPNMSYYTTPDQYNCKDPEECYNHLLRDLKLISSWGYNCIRLFNFEFGVPFHEGVQQDRPCTVDLSMYYAPFKYQVFEEPYEEHFKLLDRVLLAANSAGLKVIMVTGGKDIHNLPTSLEYDNYLQYLSKRYRNDTTLVAFDLANEPEYFHKLEDKREVKILVDQWCRSIRQFSKNQLITIGLTSSNTTFTWDPELLDVDFFSFHIYPDTASTLIEYDKHLLWLSKSLVKPWIIGETGFAASDLKTEKFIDGSIEEQVEFFNKTFKRCFDCGGIAYSWWQFHDVAWSPDYGILNSNHKAKPISDAIYTLKNYVPNFENCKSLELSFRINNTYLKKYTAQIVDKNNIPIKNAVLNAGLGGGKYEFAQTDDNGFFEFNTRKKVKILNITAQGYESRRIKTFIKGNKLILKKVNLDQEFINDWHYTTKLQYCNQMSERECTDCQKYCESDPNCKKECKKNYKLQKKTCKEKSKPSKI